MILKSLSVLSFLLVFSACAKASPASAGDSTVQQAASGTSSITEVSGGDITNISSDYVFTCVDAKDNPPDFLKSFRGYARGYSRVFLSTVADDFTLSSYVDGAAFGAVDGDTGYPKDHATACAAIEPKTQETTNQILGALFDVKTSRLQRGDHYCFTNSVRIFHAGSVVTDFQFQQHVVACP